jgi:HlyD family secretion protein
VKPGTSAVTIGLLDELTLTVYVPEDRYGKVSLGDEVAVTVDSFPDEAFSATVLRIADQAEYTPRNVQTAEGRRSTVFAVELSVNDPAGKLKPGMPADVTFGDQE